MSTNEDGCRHETGYPSPILREVFDRYYSDIFEHEHTTASGYGRATEEEMRFFLLYKYIHVSTTALRSYLPHPPHSLSYPPQCCHQAPPQGERIPEYTSRVGSNGRDIAPYLLLEGSAHGVAAGQCDLRDQVGGAAKCAFLLHHHHHH